MVNHKKLQNSFHDAWQGILLVFREEQNFRIHTILGLAALLGGLLLGIPNSHLLILIITVTGVLSAELLNSALERFLDVIKPRMSPYIQAIKDILAALVLVGAIGSVGVGLIIFYPPLVSLFFHVVGIGRF